MTYEKSCGAVVFTREDGEIKYVLAQMLGGHYDFPKGHMEAGETEEETAMREVFEEVHLKPSLISGFRCVMEYDIPTIDVHKQVVLFLGEYRNQKIIYQTEELRNALLLTYDKAMDQLTHENSKRILRQAHEFLAGRKYYEAYDDRYRQIHSQKLQWFFDNPTPSSGKRSTSLTSPATTNCWNWAAEREEMPIRFFSKGIICLQRISPRRQLITPGKSGQNFRKTSLFWTVFLEI